MTVLVAVTCTVARVAPVGIAAPFGLQGQYFLPGRATTDAPSFSTLDREVSTERVTANWAGDPAGDVQGSLVRIPDGAGLGPYTFALEADDGAVPAGR